MKERGQIGRVQIKLLACLCDVKSGKKDNLDNKTMGKHAFGARLTRENIGMKRKRTAVLSRSSSIHQPMMMQRKKKRTTMLTTKMLPLLLLYHSIVPQQPHMILSSAMFAVVEMLMD